MVPDTPLGHVVEKCFYPAEAAIYAPLYALLESDSVKGGDYITNFHNSFSSSIVGRLIYRLMCSLGLRSWFVGVVGVPWVIATQHISYGIYHTPVSDIVSGQDALSKAFVTWSEKATAAFR